MVAIDRFLFRRPQKKSIEGKQTSIKFLCDPNGCPCIRPSAAPSACQSILKRVSVFSSSANKALEIVITTPVASLKALTAFR